MRALLSPVAALILALSPVAASSAEIVWLDNLDDAVALAKKTHKPVVVDFAAVWCSSCREFATQTLPSPEVQAFADRFCWVRVDVDRDASVARAHDVKATPSFELVDADGVTRVRFEGVRSPKDFCKELEAFLASLEPGARPALAPIATVRPDEKADRTDLTWSPEGYRALSICFSNVGYGPLHLTTQSPFQSLRFGFQPRTPSTITKGVWEARVSETWSNLFAFEDKGFRYLVDFEILRSDLAVAYGLTDTMEVELEAVDKSRFGGHLDGFIETFHESFGLSQGGRKSLDRDRFRFAVDPRGGNPPFVARSGTGSFARDLLLTFQHNLTCGTDVMPAFAYALTLDTELGRPSDMSDGSPVSAGASVALSKRFWDFYGYASAGAGYFGDETLRGVKLQPLQLSGLLALEWRFAATASLVAQYLVNQGVAKHYGPFSAPSHELDAGVKWEFVRGALFELGFVENIVNFDNTPDFGFHAGFTVRF